MASALNTQQIGKNTDPRANVIGTVAFGFEQGANEGNGVFVNGLEVNHQYDKSEEFLSLTREYLGLMGRGSAPTSISALNDTPLLMRNKQALEENSFDTVRSTCADSDTALPLQTLCIYSPLANMTEIEVLCVIYKYYARCDCHLITSIDCQNLLHASGVDTFSFYFSVL